MNNKWNFNAMNIFGIFMVVVYLCAGTYVLVTHYFDYIPLEIRVILGGFLILYGIFRGVRVYFKIKNPES